MNTAASAIHDYIQSVADHLCNLPQDQRAAILDNLEAQIHEALTFRCQGAEPAAEDVEAVLAEMDPPEAFEAESAKVPGAGSGPTTPGVESRPVVGKVALYISLVSIIASLLLGGFYGSAKANSDLMSIILGAAVFGVFLALPAQLVALIVAAFSKGDENGRKAIIISLAWVVLFVIVLLGCTLMSYRAVA
jgi:hypothetical protein